jgi:serine/threonine protein kinase
VIGRRLSHYDVLADLGAGGMGVVYRAHDTRIDRDVAIKVLPTDRPLTQTARRRFQREAMAASALNHPNIITIYEVQQNPKRITFCEQAAGAWQRLPAAQER